MANRSSSSSAGMRGIKNALCGVRPFHQITARRGNGISLTSRNGVDAHRDDGNMSAHIMRNDRPLFAAKDPARGTDAELRAAFEDYGSYFGTYSIDQASQTVTHQVRGAWYPNWIGHDQVRHFKFDGSRLLLSTPPLIWNGQSFEYVLTRERIS